MNIHAERLTFRPLQISDARFFFQYLPGVDRFLSLNAPLTIEDANFLVEEYLKEQENKTAVRFVIEDKITNEFIGIVGIYSLDTDWPERHCWIRKDLQGRGYAYEAISAFMQWANSELNYKVMYSSFDTENLAMKKLNEKLGGVKGNEIPEPVLQESGKTLNILYYSYNKPL
jgi:ribosomal-protein-alanine N-acetyltransferase